MNQTWGSEESLEITCTVPLKMFLGTEPSTLSGVITIALYLIKLMQIDSYPSVESI